MSGQAAPGSLPAPAGSGARVGTGAWIIGALSVALPMALTVWLLTLPAAVRFYYPLLRGSAHAPDAVKVAEWLRTPYRERTLNLSMIGGQFTSKELKHYSEVRSLRPWPPRLSAVLAVLLLVALG
ncbi:MAG: hypothetical protein U1G07_08805, partial [Verrucomicrobiota bacterium]